MPRMTTIEREAARRSAEAKAWAEAERASDEDLLDRFVADQDEAAFETLVRRHGPRVLAICRSWLGDGQDAEDAFQMTFVVLAGRAGSIRRAASLDAWLRGVARRVAGRAKLRADRRRAREGAVMDMHEVPDRNEPDRLDLRPILAAEVGRLPEKYRLPIELCYWQGLSNEQAASRLKCATGTLKWRLSRAREILRGRLGRLGIALAALLFWWLPADAEAGFDAFGDDLGEIGPAGSGEPSILPSRLVRRTVELSLQARDAALRIAREEREAEDLAHRKGRKRRQLLLWIGLAASSIAAAASAAGWPLSATGHPTRALSASESPAASGRSCH